MSKRKIKTTFIFIFSIIIFVIFLYNINCKSKVYNTMSVNRYIKNIPYGKSKYYDLKGDILIQTEQFITQKHYIEYSWVSGDKSCFAIIFVVEDINKNPLPESETAQITVTDEKQNKYTPFPYYEFVAYPQDDPLKYKKLIYAKFEPLKTDSKFIDCEIIYNNSIFNMKNINIK